MKGFFTLLKNEIKLSIRDMNMLIFAIAMPLVILIVLGVIYGGKPAFSGAAYSFMEQSFLGISTGTVWIPVTMMIIVMLLCTGLFIRFFRWE